MGVHSIGAKIHRATREHMPAWNVKETRLQTTTWSPPIPGIIKINFDTAVREDFSVGAVVMCDQRGKVVGAQICKEIVDSPLEGEAVAT